MGLQARAFYWDLTWRCFVPGGNLTVGLVRALGQGGLKRSKASVPIMLVIGIMDNVHEAGETRHHFENVGEFYTYGARQKAPAVVVGTTA
jgi:hypothetical protein